MLLAGGGLINIPIDQNFSYFFPILYTRILYFYSSYSCLFFLFSVLFFSKKKNSAKKNKTQTSHHQKVKVHFRLMIHISRY